VATELKIIVWRLGLTASYLIKKCKICLTSVPLIVSVCEFCFV